MTIEAVAVLQTIARDEFERDWNGFEDPLEFLNGQPWDDGHPPVKEIIVELGGKSYVFPSADVAAVIQQWEEFFRYEVENEEDEEDEDEGTFNWSADSEEQTEEKIWAKVHEYWFGQLDNADEATAVLDNRLDYMVRGFQELVAYCDMIGERIPELKPVMVEKLQAAHDEVMQHLQEWIDQQPDA
jgi:hypothetical protein